MRLQKYINEVRKIKSGDWVKGTGETLFGSKMVYGIFVSKVGNFDLVATWEYKGKIKRKIYVRLQDVVISTKQSEAPKDLMKFAKKHSMFGSSGVHTVRTLKESEVEYIVENYQVKMRKPEKFKKLNLKTNRMKTSRKQRFMETDIPPEERSFKNLPKYADGSSKVRFTDWLEIEAKPLEDGGPPRWGWSKNGKCYGWSHRAVYGFKAGDKVTGDSAGKKVEYPKLPNGDYDWDNGDYEPDFVIRDRKHAEEVAKTFADNVS